MQKVGMAAQAAVNQERGMAFEMAFLPTVLSFGKRLEQGTRSTLSLKKKVEARLKEAKKLRLIFPFIYTQPSRPQTCLPLPLMSGEVEVPMEGSFSDLEMSNLVSKGNW